MADPIVEQPCQYFTETVEPLNLETLGVPIAYVRSGQDVALPPGGYGWAREIRRATRRATLVRTRQPRGCFTQVAALAEALLKA